MNTENAVNDDSFDAKNHTRLESVELESARELNIIDNINNTIVDFGKGNTLLSQALLETLNEAIPSIRREVSDFVLIQDGIEYPLYQEENTIGRKSTNDLVIEHPSISRNHATITISTDKIEIKDHSLNGTCVNFEKINNQSMLLKVGDEIAIRDYSYTLERKPNKKDLLIAEIGTEIAFVQKASNYNRANRPNAGFSLIELLIVITVIGIISAISVANLVSSRRAANGASAIQSMRVISSSQASYNAGVGNGEYALPSALLNESYIDSSIASACLPTPTTNQTPKSGYIFVFNTTTGDSNTNNLPAFNVSARPIVVNGIVRSGDRSFFVDQTGVLRLSNDPSILADANSQPLQ